MTARSNVWAKIAHLRARGLLDDAWGRSIERALLDGMAIDADLAELEQRYASALKDQTLGRGVPFEAPRLDTPSVVLGKDHNGAWVRRDLIGSPTHMAVVGATGAGKTSLLVPMLLQLMVTVRVLAIDSYKRDLRHLVPLARRLGRRLAIITPQDFGWNPLEPDGVDPTLHLETALSQFCRCFDVPSRSAMLLRQVAHDAGRSSPRAAGTKRRAR